MLNLDFSFITGLHNSFLTDYIEPLISQFFVDGFCDKVSPEFCSLKSCPLQQNTGILFVCFLYTNNEIGVTSSKLETDERIDEDKTRHISIEIHFNLKPIPEVEQVTA